MNIDSLIESLTNLRIEQDQPKTMDSNIVQSLVSAAIKEATEQTRREFQTTVDELTRRLTILETPTVTIEHKEIEIVSGVECNETLDVVKSVPEFCGDTSRYISWRQAATTAHKLYEKYVGSSKYYQAVAILRNKIVGKADTVLSSYNTVLNYYAILERLDFAYADKRSIFTLEQELSTLSQNSKTIIDFYNEVEEKLNLIINKTIMTYEGDTNLIASLNNKYRQDALRVFVSGLKKPLCDILFSCKPADMPMALAIAQEMTVNRSRYNFARAFSTGLNGPFPIFLVPLQTKFILDILFIINQFFQILLSQDLNHNKCHSYPIIKTIILLAIVFVGKRHQDFNNRYITVFDLHKVFSLK